MSSILIFSDASVDPELKTGFGAYLALGASELDTIDPAALPEGRLRVKQFMATSSTQLEIETLLWALQESAARHSTADNITLYTDSQGITGLPRRRAALERSGFTNAAGGTLAHAGLYRAFYQLLDRLGFKLVKLKGHSKGAAKTRLDRVFSYVDKAARKALREYRAGGRRTP